MRYPSPLTSFDEPNNPAKYGISTRDDDPPGKRTHRLCIHPLLTILTLRYIAHSPNSPDFPLSKVKHVINLGAGDAGATQRNDVR